MTGQGLLNKTIQDTCADGLKPAVVRLAEKRPQRRQNVTSANFMQTFTRPEMAKRLGVSERQIYRLLAKEDPRVQAVVSRGVISAPCNIARLLF
jgi:DNA-directed RNA polymerase specialized sigma subunit